MLLPLISEVVSDDVLLRHSVIMSFIHIHPRKYKLWLFCSQLLWISEEGCQHRIAFNSLYLFSFRSINYEANGEELYNVTRGVTASCLPIVRELPQFLPPIS